MPLPDLARPSRVEAKLLLSKPPDGNSITLITCPGGTTLRLRTVYVSNASAISVAFNLTILRSSVQYPLHSGVTIPSKNLFNCTTIDDAIYLEPGDAVVFTQISSSPNILTLFMSYEIIT